MRRLVRNIWNLILLLLFPPKFVDTAVSDAWRQFSEAASKLPESEIPETIPPDKRAEWTASFTERATSLRASIFTSLVILALAVVASYFTTLVAKTLDWNFSNSTRPLQLTSLALFVWATLGEVGWNLQTWSGTSLPEVANRFWFRTLYTVGAYLGSLTFWW